MAAAFLPIIIIVLFLLRQNLIVILGTATAYAYWAFGDGVISNIVVDAWDAANKDILLSIPLFILAGNIMSRGGMASRLIDLMKSLTAPIPGGLAIATILSCAAFAAVSGSGTVTLLAIGTLMYPALINAGYPKSFALGALCAAGTLGIVVPPEYPSDLIRDHDSNFYRGFIHCWYWPSVTSNNIDAWICNYAEFFSQRKFMEFELHTNVPQKGGLGFIDANHYLRRDIYGLFYCH